MTPDSIAAVYAGLEPTQVWRHFGTLNAIPRPSGQEAAARDWIEKLADDYGATFRRDTRGNCVVSVAASAGYEARPAVAIQSHLDMVCEKRPNVAHDFDHDAIRPRREGDLILGSGTTLGADNGLGVALSLALLTTPDLQHPPLELLFTVEEENGLHGAADLDGALLTAHWLINLDSEDPEEIIIGCAGGRGVFLHLPLAWAATADDDVAREIVVSGLKGGHSGVQINEPLGNAIQILTEVLHSTKNEMDLRVARIDGGRAHNAIPRDASAVIVVAPNDVARLETLVAAAADDIRNRWRDNEPALQIEIVAAKVPQSVVPAATSVRWIELLASLPHGVLEMSQRFEGKVQTSCNLASIVTRDETATIHLSARSFLSGEMERVIQQIAAIGEQSGATNETESGYPGWEPQADAPLIALTARAHQTVYGSEAKVQVIHAGLECGIILAHRPQMAAVSFGPLIHAPHTPEENVTISSVAPCWQMLLELLRSL